MKVDTISWSFKKAGIVDSRMDVVCDMEENPFVDVGDSVVPPITAVHRTV